MTRARTPQDDPREVEREVAAACALLGTIGDAATRGKPFDVSHLDALLSGTARLLVELRAARLAQEAAQ